MILSGVKRKRTSRIELFARYRNAEGVPDRASVDFLLRRVKLYFDDLLHFCQQNKKPEIAKSPARRAPPKT